MDLTRFLCLLFFSVLQISQNASLVKILQDQQVILSEAYPLPDIEDPEQVAEAEYYSNFFSDYVDATVQDPSEPISDIYVPIIDSAIDHVQVYGEKNGGDIAKKEGNMVGIMAMSIYWKDTIKNILPPGSDGVVVVFENECNPTFTFRIDGPDAYYLGQGDGHDPTYDDMEVSSWFNHLTSSNSNSGDYTGIPLDEEYCPFHLRVYPSDAMRARYITNDATIFTIASVLIFMFSAVVFWLYDYMVEQRQDKVYKTAVRSTAIVSSLFPSTVTDRLYGAVEQDQTQQGSSNNTSRAFRTSDTARVRSAMQDLNNLNNNETTLPIAGRYKTAAIADLFPEAVSALLVFSNQRAVYASTLTDLLSNTSFQSLLSYFFHRLSCLATLQVSLLGVQQEILNKFFVSWRQSMVHLMKLVIVEVSSR